LDRNKRERRRGKLLPFIVHNIKGNGKSKEKVTESEATSKEGKEGRPRLSEAHLEETQRKTKEEEEEASEPRAIDEGSRKR